MRDHQPLATAPVKDLVSSDAQASLDPSGQMPIDVPSGVRPMQFRWGYGIAIILIHALALLAVLPFFFSWTGVILAVIGFLVFHMLGINIGYHRLLTHQGFSCSKAVERTLATLGVCTLQDTPARWVAIHRQHHQHSDDTPDPHSPLVGFLWGHIGWILINNRQHASIAFYDRYAKDILRDPYYLWLERGTRWLWVYIAHALLYWAVALGVGWAIDGSYPAAARFAFSVLIWGVFVRTVLVWEITWSVNSVTHIWGYRNYDTSDNSRNNWLIGILALGEGWHNNHHADQRSARHGHRWWEFDPTYLAIRFLERLGVAHNVARPVVPRELTRIIHEVRE
jgi:stearoyl-CoA desaturase (delta-9 desaturase)